LSHKQVNWAENNWKNASFEKSMGV
jgi:hypothetical protein